MMVKDYDDDDDDGGRAHLSVGSVAKEVGAGKQGFVPKSMAHDIASKALFHFRRY